MSSLTLRGLSKTFPNGVTALYPLELALGAGERLVLVDLHSAGQPSSVAAAHLSIKSGAATGVGIGIRGDGTKLLDRVERNAEHAGERAAVDLIVDVDAVQRHVGLVAFAAVHGAAAGTRRVLAEERYAGLER